MNAAWGITTDFKEITISMSEHKTKTITKHRLEKYYKPKGEFTPRLHLFEGGLPDE